MRKNLPFIIWILMLTSISLGIVGCNSTKSQEEMNVAVLQKLYNEGINQQNLDIISSSLAEEYVRHCQAMPPSLQEIHGKEKMLELFKGHFAAFPDWHEEIEIKAVDDNTIAYLSKGIGTQTGQAGNLPAKGKKCELDHVIIHRFENGKIVESWVSWDNLNLLTQLGHFPPETENNNQEPDSLKTMDK